MKNNLPSLSRYKKDYNDAKSLGAPALACNAVLIPVGFENLRLLFQNFPRPMITMNDPADVDYPGGLAAHVPGTPKTNYEGSVTAIETEKGTLDNFAEALVKMGGELPLCRVVFGVSDGASNNGSKVYELQDVAITFSDGGGEIDASSRSQILTVSGSLRYMYFGSNADLGKVGADAFDNLNSALSNTLNGTNNSGLNMAINGLVNLVGNGFSIPSNTSVVNY